MIPSDPLLLLNIDELLLPHRPSREDLASEKAAREVEALLSSPEAESSLSRAEEEGASSKGVLPAESPAESPVESPAEGDQLGLQVNTTSKAPLLDDWEVLPNGEDLSKSQVPAVSIYGLSGIENDQVQFLLRRILSGSDVGSSASLTPPPCTTPQKRQPQQQHSLPPSPLKSPLPPLSPAPSLPQPPPPPPPLAPLSEAEQKARIRLVQAMLDVKW